MNTIREQESECFNEWQDSRPGLILDGVVNEADYVRSTPKLVFVLKEVNGCAPNWDLRTFLREKGGKGPTWNNVTRWIAALAPGGDRRSWNEVKKVNKSLRMDRLKSIVAMNLKKTSGGASSKRSEIERFAREDERFIERQISLYDPDFFVFCGVDPELVPQIRGVPARRTSRGIRFWEYKPGKYGIGFWHPQARFPAKLLYYFLADAAKELRGGP